ncbi:MAG: Ty1/Copia family ribonuclease HI, partial [Paenibacillus sp.]|uniref:Ty1/Copia family ribonuclease HI n=1 Tax=Paenibacillus sp. TaxID=58172 RepID=UPI003B7E145E
AKRQASTAGSSTEAEYISQYAACKEASWLRHLLAELEFFDSPMHPRPPKALCWDRNVDKLRGELSNSSYCITPMHSPPTEPHRDPLPPTTMYCDNSGAIALAKNPELMTQQSKHIKIGYHYIRHQIQQKKISISYLYTYGGDDCGYHDQRSGKN